MPDVLLVLNAGSSSLRFSVFAVGAGDILTAQLSGNPKIQLLERNEMEKVYREQGMSAANRDDLKLGRIYLHYVGNRREIYKRV